MRDPGVGTNRYAYSANDPINKTDPNGHLVWFAVAACFASSICEDIAVAAAAAAAYFATKETTKALIGVVENSAEAPPNEEDQNSVVSPPDADDQNDTSGESQIEAEPQSKWEVPDAVKDKLPKAWGEGVPNKKGVGTRWQDPNNKGNGVRVDKGNPNSSQNSQKEYHVVVRVKGQVIGRDGKPIKGTLKEDPENGHIPLKEYEEWEAWDHP